MACIYSEINKCPQNKKNAQSSPPEYLSHYSSPLGEILLTADNLGLTGLHFEGQWGSATAMDERECAIFDKVRPWLDLYFSGKDPDVDVPLHLTGTAFQLRVWKLLLAIPYGATTTYGTLARRVAAEMGMARMSAQAVGGAVHRNPIALIVPCHRVIGAGGNLTGYASGLDRKAALLHLEANESMSAMDGTLAKCLKPA